MKKIMIALGGNALGEGPKEQLELTREIAKPIADLVADGHSVVLAHGNGPQVGMIRDTFEIASKIDTDIFEMPFPESGAMSQGYIGYHLQNAISYELRKRKIEKPVVSVVTQVIVDENDPAFQNPTKPIGSFYSKEKAEELERTKAYSMIEDSGRGYRRVVPSPQPVDIVEKKAIKDLVDNGSIVIAVGGGGIPTILKDEELIGVDAVIDKDLASEKLAEMLDCDTLFILTAVEKVAINFGKPNQENLDHISLEEAKRYIGEGQFPAGSMLPKIEAAMVFVESGPGRVTVISSLENAQKAINGETGTRIQA